MATFVIIHGAWAGGYEFHTVASLLRQAGHEVYTPTLTGLSERVHLAHPNIDLDTHIQDILAVLEYEDLRHVILVGYSYGGMIASGVAERIPERLGHVVYVDAFLPTNDQSVAEIVGPEFMAPLLEAARNYGDGWRIPPDPTFGPRQTAHPLKTFTQKLRMVNRAAALLPRTFIYCTEDEKELGTVSSVMKQAAEKTSADPNWRYRELKTGHVPAETMPHELTALLLEVV